MIGRKALSVEREASLRECEMSPEEQKAREHYEKAMTARKAGDKETAFAQLQECLTALRALQDKPSQGRVWALVGELHAEAGEHARALSSFELAASLLDGNELRRERTMILFKLAAAAHATGQDSRAIEAYDDIIRFTQDAGDARLDGMARLLRGQITFQRGGQRHGIEQMVLGATRLQSAQAPEAKRGIELVRQFGGEMPRNEYEKLIKDLCERRELREALL